MTTKGQGDQLEPELVERFKLFDHLDVPPPPFEAAEQRHNVVSISRGGVGSPDEEPYRDQRRGSGWLVGAAAAVVVVGGLSFAALNLQSSDTSGVEAGEIEAAQDADSDDGGETLVIEAAGTTVPTSSVDDSSTPAKEESVDEVQPTSSIPPSTSAPEISQVETPAAIVADNSPLTLAPDSSSSSTSTPPSTWTSTPTSAPPTSSDSWIDVVKIQGTVTEVFTDCQSRWILNDANEPEQVGPVSCDGGSYIVVDGQRIQTSSGYATVGSAYNRHPRNLRPGTTVTVTAMDHSNGIVSLDCARCSVVG